MVKNSKQSSSKINCKVNNEKKHKRHRLQSIQRKPKESTHIRYDQSDQPDYNPVASGLSSLPCVPDCLAEEEHNQVKNDNHLHCSSSALEVSSTNRLVDLTVDSDECITIEEDTTNNASKLKSAFQKRQEQFQLYPFCTSLKQQCDLTPENHDISINKKQFEEDMKVLQDGIQSHINHGRRQRPNSDLYFNAIKRLNNNCYIKQLLQEEEELHLKFQNAKKNLNIKCKLIINKINAIQKVYCTIQKLFKFSMHQRKVILFKEKWLKSKKSKVIKYNRSLPKSFGTKFLHEEYIVSQQHMRDLETNMEKVSTDIPFPPEVLSENQPEIHDSTVFGNNLFYSDVSTVIQPEINKEKVSSDNPSLELRDQELSDAKKKASMLLEQLKRTQDELQKVRREMYEQMNTIQQNADCEQNKMKVQLSEIRAMLKDKMGSANQIGNIMEHSMSGVTCQNMLWDIRWLVEECVQLKGDAVTENVEDTAIASDGLKVTENEVQLVILIAFFLKVIPFSVNTEFIHTYLKNIDNAISLEFVANLLNKFPTVFKGETVSAGSLEMKWCYLNLRPIITV